MAHTIGRYGPRWSWLGKLACAASKPFVRAFAAYHHFFPGASLQAQTLGRQLRRKLRRGETVYVAGLGVGGHNTGAALIAVSPRGITLLGNHEEERYSAIKHCADFPQHALAVLKEQLARLHLRPRDIHALVASWNYVDSVAQGVAAVMEELPQSVTLLRPEANPPLNGTHFLQGMTCAARLAQTLGLEHTPPLLGLRHHDNHAYFSWAVSPFAHSREPVMVAVIDGAGDDGSISTYLVQDGRMRLLWSNQSLYDSPGLLYGFLSSTQGGWTFNSSEGRYMGAAAWGDNNRLTNPYYRRLRQLVFFGSEGSLFLNRSWAGWHSHAHVRPYRRPLVDLLGPPIPPEKMWNPDAILNVENVEHSPITRDRVDKAAATQLLFEDILFHLIGHLIHQTRAHKLVLTGGTALNCVANMRLLAHFDETYYERNLEQKDTRLQLWMPPTPGDAGVPMGAAYHFALRHGAVPGAPLHHAFYCGLEPTTADIRRELHGAADMGYLILGKVSDSRRREHLADLLAWVVSQNGVVGLFQGVAETGPRALGHRSILANPANPSTRENLNRLVKFRELVRPLAPMATYEAAQRWFDLCPGAAADHYNAYNYMVLTAQARPEAYAVIPAVIHADGTCRVQIVRPEVDPFCHAYLKAMGRRIGAEVSVNTSLNVGSPIVQTPAQALDCLRRSKGMTGLLMIAAEGDAFFVWHDVVQSPKDGGHRLRSLVEAWKAQVRAEEADTALVLER